MDYESFIKGKCRWTDASGMNASDILIPGFLYDFQAFLVEWALQMGRSAIFADCGLGKTPMQLAWADNVIRHTAKPVLIATPLSVGRQTVQEASKFGIEAERVRDGRMPKATCVVVTNYEQLHKYEPEWFSGVVCDESSAIKDFKSQRKSVVTEFMNKVRFRLLCTATAAPNDYHELGTSSEALGYLGYRDMLTIFFKMEQQGGAHAWGRTKFRFRGHAEQPFWSWVCSWARAIRTPEDIGFDGSRFVLPELNQHEHVISANTARAGALFDVPAKTMEELREERRRTIGERCGKVADILNAIDSPSVAWCELNPEGDELVKVISGAEQVSGSMPDEKKEELLDAFSVGELKRLVIKPKIGAWGLNWQHCADTAILPSFSFEQHYQAVRRFYRFGQDKPVNVHNVVSEGQEGIVKSLSRKQRQAENMFSSIVRHMQDAMSLASDDRFPIKEEVPAWV